MIREAELRRYAANQGIDPMILNLDYALGWFLAAFYTANNLGDHLRFKGGTCLRKAYFPEHRFSEDLDFTATSSISSQQLEAWVERATRWSTESGGPDFLVARPRFEETSDGLGAETLQARIYFRGPLRFGGSPQAIRLDITRKEVLIFPVEMRPLIHPYSDVVSLGQIALPCYPLAEMLAEKIRAIGGQRRFAISRDIYDIHILVQRGVNVASIIPHLMEKFAARGVDVRQLSLRAIRTRQGEFERDWNRNLVYLLPEGQSIPFTDAWNTTLAILAELEPRQGPMPKTS